MELEELQEKVKSNPDNSVISTASNLGKTNNIAERLAALKRGNKCIQRPVYNLDKRTKIQELTWEVVKEESEEINNTDWSKINTYEAYNEVKALEDAIRQRRQILEKTKECELERINKEFYLNNYEQRYNVGM